MHPGQYTVLNSPKDEVARSAIRELDYHAQFIRAVDPRAGTVTLHVGGAYGDKEGALKRFKENFAMLSPLAQESLILENDDKTFHALDVLGLCEALRVRMVFDFFHHSCHPSGETWQDGLEAILKRVVATWRGRVPKFHLSSLKPGTRASHADYIEPEDFRTFTELLEGIGEDQTYDLMLEAKAKDRAVLRAMDEVVE
jgi:UV DNA damage endonuclease